VRASSGHICSGQHWTWCPLTHVHLHVTKCEVHPLTNVIPILTIYKYQLSLTNPRDALNHGKRTANKDGRSVWLW